MTNQDSQTRLQRVPSVEVPNSVAVMLLAVGAIFGILLCLAIVVVMTLAAPTSEDRYFQDDAGWVRAKRNDWIYCVVPIASPHLQLDFEQVAFELAWCGEYEQSAAYFGRILDNQRE